MVKIDGALALVTGAGSGIGRATATALAQRGARVIVCDVDGARTQEIAAELGDRCVLARAVDVGDRAQMRALADEVHGLAPAVDVLVNNAGVAVGGGILDTTLADWDWLLRVNLGGVIHGCHFFAPRMAERRRGHIVNVSSMFGYFAPPGVVAYVASKFGVLGMSLSMRSELAAHGVGVSAICPGMINTNIVADARSAPTFDTFKSRTAETFLKRGAPPSKVAAAILAAIERDRPIVPVAPEAWISWGLMRAVPRLGIALGSRLQSAWTSGRRL